MPKINLLYIITKLELGGAQKQLLSLIENLDKEKFRPFLFTAQSGLLLQEAASIPGLTIKKSKYLERAISPLKDIAAFFEIYSFIRKGNIDIVHTHSSKAGILGRSAAKLAGTRIIVHTVHGWSFNDFQPWPRRKIFIWLERFTACFTDKIVVVCQYDKKRGLSNQIGRESKYVLIHYGINYAEFIRSSQNIKQELGIPAKDLVVGMVSCFKPQKAPQDFIRLAYLVKQSVPNVKFVLVGDGILRNAIEKLILRLSLGQQVILTGWRRDMAKILSGLDVFVLTSLWEGLPISVLEAMALSCPVVVTDTGGIKEVINERETGFVVTPQDTRNMSRLLVTLLKDENLRQKIGQNAKDSVDRRFHVENMVNNSECLYEDLIKISRYAN